MRVDDALQVVLECRGAVGMLRREDSRCAPARRVRVQVDRLPSKVLRSAFSDAPSLAAESRGANNQRERAGEHS